MKRVFVYEHLSGGAAGSDAADELLGAGRAMRDAVVADLLSVPGLCVSVAGAAPAGAVAVDVGEGDTAAALVSREAARHDLVWVIAPETEGLLAQLQRAAGDARWLGCSAAAIELCASKQATLARLAAHGLCTPLAFEAAAETRRWVVKPDDGAGALDTRLHRSRDAAEADRAARQRAGRAAVLEPWVDGHALSLSLLCAARGVELLSVNRQHIDAAADGTVSFQGVIANTLGAADARAAPLHDLARQVGQAIGGLRGFVGVDLVWHPQRGPVLIEVNPRVTCAYVGLSATLGRNLAADVLAAHEPDGDGDGDSDSDSDGADDA